MKRKFSDILSKAIAGDKASMEVILDLYAPLIDRHSMIYGYIDEDCRQYIIMRIITTIRKFKI